MLLLASMVIAFTCINSYIRHTHIYIIKINKIPNLLLQLSIYLSIYLSMMCTHICGVYVQKSEDNLGEFILSFYPVNYGG